MQQCQSCGGVYAPVQADGTRYFHACPPLSAPELAAAVAAGAVQLPAGETADEAVERRTYVRANARNENVAGLPATDGADAPIVSEGAGSFELVALDPQPAVVTVTTPPPPSPLSPVL